MDKTLDSWISNAIFIQPDNSKNLNFISWDVHEVNDREITGFGIQIDTDNSNTEKYSKNVFEMHCCLSLFVMNFTFDSTRIVATCNTSRFGQHTRASI